MKIAADKVVTLHYTLKSENGKEIESSLGGEPLAYIHGADNLLPGLESRLDGKVKGDKVSGVVPAGEAFGDYEPELVEEVARSEFDEDEELVVGKEFQYDDEDGNVGHVRILEIGPDVVKIDGNHPLAGQALAFDVEVLDVRDATKDELSHGHVHGAGGHHHH